MGPSLCRTIPCFTNLTAIGRKDLPMNPFNPFAHFSELVFSNITIDLFNPGVQPADPYAMLPDGTLVTAATYGQPESVDYFVLGSAGSYVEINDAQFIVQSLYLHFAYGAALPDVLTASPTIAGMGLAGAVQPVTAAELIVAARDMPNATDDALAGFTDVDIIGYIEAHAGAWVL
jgi:hypothetical protein